MNHNRQGQQYIYLFSSLHTLDVFAICFPQSGYPSAVLISKTRMSKKAMTRMLISVSKFYFERINSLFFILLESIVKILGLLETLITMLLGKSQIKSGYANMNNMYMQNMSYVQIKVIYLFGDLIF